MFFAVVCYFRLSRARRVSENAFGILVKRFKLLQKQIELEPEMSAKIVLACCGLHNYLMNRKTDIVHNLAGPDVDRFTNLIPGGIKKVQLFFFTITTHINFWSDKKQQLRNK